MKRAIRALLWLVLCLAPATMFPASVELFAGSGLTAQAVRQGNLGSCFFHASIASLAAARPELLRDAIRQDANGKLSVRFSDGKVENVYLEDVQYARSSGFDKSEGLWVAVLFRGFAQRTLRAALLSSLQKSKLGPLLTLPMSGLIANNDLVLLAYDRAIRTQIDQQGNVDRAALKARLRQELDVVPVDSRWKDRAVDLLDSSTFFAEVTAAVKANGELFGAYRAVGQGGLPEAVLRAFAGESRSYRVESEQTTANAISSALRDHLAVVVWTGERYSPALVAKWGASLSSKAEDWYVPAHAYSVVAINSEAGTVTVRNPWGHHPDPAGEFTLPLNAVSSAYAGYSTSISTQGRTGPGSEE